MGGLEKNVGFWALPKVKGRDKIPAVHVSTGSTTIANMAIHVNSHRYVAWQLADVAVLNNYDMT
jgi:hypothetical protein